MKGRAFGRSLAIVFALSPALWGQTTPFPFQILFTEGTNAITLQNGTTVGFNSPIGQTANATVVATYMGSGRATISVQPTVFGSPAFKSILAATLPITLAPGQTVQFSIAFTPTSSAQTNAQINLPFVEDFTSIPPTESSSAIEIGLTGSASTFALSYSLTTNQNVVPLQQGGTIMFPATQLGATSQALLNASNVGSGSGSVTGITLTGAAFQLTGIPLFPTAVAAGQTLQVGVIYTPTGVATDTGQITVSFDTGSPITINLQGSGISSSLVYQITGNPPTVVPPGGAVPFPATNVGQTSSVTVRVLNSGNANGTVSSVAVSGQGFQITNPQVLPQVLAPNASLTFNISFTPAQPGNLTGNLFINSDTLSLTGMGLGSQLAFSYLAGGNTITLGSSNNSVVFSPVEISQSETTVLNVQNTGTLPATISNIGISQNTSQFSVSGLPSLPVSLKPGSSFPVSITFTPATVGFSNGTLMVDTNPIQLIGSGAQPPPLPSYSLQGPNGTATPMSQPSVSLALSAAYPVALTGVLTLGISGTSTPDPAVQFSSGGLTVPFTIPANGTNALFANQATQVFLQTGTVASTITLTPSFATQAGGVSLTPAAPATLQFTIAAAPPVLITSTIASQSSNTISLSIVGYSTTRSLTSLSVQLTAASGFTIPTSQFTVDLTQISTAWFQGAASDAFGGQFSLTVPLTFQGSLPSGQSLTSAVTSVSVGLSNSAGASNKLTTPLQ
jgi:hypothetical protein